MWWLEGWKLGKTGDFSEEVEGGDVVRGRDVVCLDEVSKVALSLVMRRFTWRVGGAEGRM